RRRQDRGRGEDDPQGRGAGWGRRGEPLYPPVRQVLVEAGPVPGEPRRDQGGLLQDPQGGRRRVAVRSPPDHGLPRAGKAAHADLDVAGGGELYRVGGVHASVALPYGTTTTPRVDKIFGPVNVCVATPKRLVYGTVDIDMIARPSELLVIADGTANPDHVTADLLCEAE